MLASEAKTSLGVCDIIFLSLALINRINATLETERDEAETIYCRQWEIDLYEMRCGEFLHRHCFGSTNQLSFSWRFIYKIFLSRKLRVSRECFPVLLNNAMPNNNFEVVKPSLCHFTRK